jgi:hypothetical protein
MPKEHYCKKSFDSVICGQINPEKFHKGKFSICKDCNKKEIYELRKKEKELEKKNESDPDFKFKAIAEESILRTQFKDGLTIEQNLEIIKNKHNLLEDKYGELSEDYKKLMIDYKESLKTNNEMMKTFIQMKNSFEEYKIFCVNLKKYVDDKLSTKNGEFIPKGKLGE